MTLRFDSYNPSVPLPEPSLPRAYHSDTKSDGRSFLDSVGNGLLAFAYTNAAPYALPTALRAASEVDHKTWKELGVRLGIAAGGLGLLSQGALHVVALAQEDYKPALLWLLLNSVSLAVEGTAKLVSQK